MAYLTGSKYPLLYKIAPKASFLLFLGVICLYTLSIVMTFFAAIVALGVYTFSDPSSSRTIGAKDARINLISNSDGPLIIFCFILFSIQFVSLFAYQLKIIGDEYIVVVYLLLIVLFWILSFLYIAKDFDYIYFLKCRRVTLTKNTYKKKINRIICFSFFTYIALVLFALFFIPTKARFLMFIFAITFIASYLILYPHIFNMALDRYMAEKKKT